MSGAYTHRPVLLEAIRAIRPDGVYVERHLGPGRAFGGDCQGTDRRRSPALYRPGQPGLEEGQARLAPWAEADHLPPR